MSEEPPGWCDAGGSRLFSCYRARPKVVRIFKVILVETAVAIARLGMAGTLEMNDNVARVADNEVPVRRRHDRDRESPSPFPSMTSKPPLTGFPQTEQTSPDSWSCMIVVDLGARLQSPIPGSHSLWRNHAFVSSPSLKSLRMPASTSFRLLPHRMREVFSTSRYFDSSPCFGNGASARTCGNR